MITKGRDSKWLLVLNEIVLKTFTSMAKVGSDLSVRAREAIEAVSMLEQNGLE